MTSRNSKAYWQLFEDESDFDPNSIEHSDKDREIPSTSAAVGTTAVDGNALSGYARRVQRNSRNSNLNVKNYDQRKTIAQGMLDVALLTANSTQLKGVIEFRKNSQFYTLLVTLITISICLQLVQACIICVLGIVFDLNKVEQHRRTNIANNILLLCTVASVAVNIMVSTFDYTDN